MQCYIVILKIKLFSFHIFIYLLIQISETKQEIHYRQSHGRSTNSKYSPENIALYLQNWKDFKESWHFKSIANDEAMRICFDPTLMDKQTFDIFLQYWADNNSTGRYLRMQAFCDEIQKQFEESNKDDQILRTKMKRVLKIRKINKDPQNK